MKSPFTRGTICCCAGLAKPSNGCWTHVAGGVVWLAVAFCGRGSHDDRLTAAAQTADDGKDEPGGRVLVRSIRGDVGGTPLVAPVVGAPVVPVGPLPVPDVPASGGRVGPATDAEPGAPVTASADADDGCDGTGSTVTGAGMTAGAAGGAVPGGAARSACADRAGEGWAASDSGGATGDRGTLGRSSAVLVPTAATTNRPAQMNPATR
ncbi:MAG: hypothetical protein ACXV3A_03465 [Kineosporiaceae bacterium]